jgi:hypothetical protein
MSNDEADSLRGRRNEEQPRFEWVVQRRAADDRAVLRLPGRSGIDRSTVTAQKGEPTRHERTSSETLAPSVVSASWDKYLRDYGNSVRTVESGGSSVVNTTVCEPRKRERVTARAWLLGRVPLAGATAAS